ncbi:hypothetical protein HQN90_36885 [Paenibacillus alba]|uniref:hypothetical protein n=1 Tax=Paenibacillus alba TaxID=1197127 RepID=UPI001563A620|nr:hypothetical protein [Paenibacillus alba]NQX71669.1 hypothetical protein [Paenibacillus alba]
MSSVYLDKFRIGRESKSYVDSLHAVLTAAGMFTGPKYMLSGLTGMAFKFSVHERLLPLSVSAYGNWVNEHGPAVDNVGLLSDRDAGRTRHPTFRFYQQAAIDWTRRSLDRGIGVIYWIPEFGVIRGYDDEDSVFFVQDGMSDEDQIVLYDNLGLNFTGFWYAEAVADAIDVPLETMALESIRLALDDWTTPHKTLPNTDIGSGRLAYSFMIRALLKGDYDVFGARYIIESYIYARDEIRHYLEDIHHLWPELVEASRLYAAIGDTFEGWDMADVPALVRAFETALALEEGAMDRFRKLSDRLHDPKRTVVPRWGKSTPR